MIRRQPLPLKTKKVAVIGAGASGMTSAYLMHLANRVHGRQVFDITVFESRPYLGGEAATYGTMPPQYPPFPTADGQPPLDTGFIFGHPDGYRSLKWLLAWFNISRCMNELSITAPTDGIGSPVWTTKSAWPVDATAERTKLPPPGAYAELDRFEKLASGIMQSSLVEQLMPFKLWLDYHDFSQAFFNNYLLPPYSLLFICKTGMLEMPAAYMLTMFKNESHKEDPSNPWLSITGTTAKTWAVCNGSSLLYRKIHQEMTAAATPAKFHI